MKPSFRLPDEIPGLPGIIPGGPPADPGPRIIDQLKCPPGTHRQVGAGPNAPCVNDDPSRGSGRLIEIPDEGFAGPLPPPRAPTPARPPPRVIVEPPPLPPPAAPPPVAPSTTLPDATTGRYFPRPGTLRLPNLIEAAGRAGLVLWVLGTLVFAPYFRPVPRSPPSTRDLLESVRPRSSGPPRRTRGPRVATPDEFPWGRDPYRTYHTLPRPPGTGLLVPDIRGTPRVATPTRQPRVASPAHTALPDRPRTLPGARPSVRGVPAPAPWTLGSPIPGPGYDPFSVAPPTPATRPAPAPSTTRRPVRFPVWLPGGSTVSSPSARPRTRDPLTRQPAPTQPRPRTPTRPPLTPQPPTGLTPFQDPVLQPQPQQFRKPTQSNPCTTERTARRKRQRECKRYTTKEIRVCADK